MGQRQAVTSKIGDQLQAGVEGREIYGSSTNSVELTGWHRDYCRAAIARASATLQLGPAAGDPGRRSGPTWWHCLSVCWSSPATPAGKRLAPMLATIVASLAP